MIKQHSDDPDVEAAANKALKLIQKALADLPEAKTFDYGGHILHLGEYDVCKTCTSPIAEAQQAANTVAELAANEHDETVKEHLEIAAQLFRTEAEAAIIRAELHNGRGSEKILNTVLGYLYDHQVHDEYKHSHHQGD
jgi:hypothetical protein